MRKKNCEKLRSPRKAVVTSSQPRRYCWFQDFISHWAPRSLRSSKGHNVWRDVSCFGVRHRSSRIASLIRRCFVFVSFLVPTAELRFAIILHARFLLRSSDDCSLSYSQIITAVSQTMETGSELAMQPKANAISWAKNSGLFCLCVPGNDGVLILLCSFKRPFSTNTKLQSQRQVDIRHASCSFSLNSTALSSAPCIVTVCCIATTCKYCSFIFLTINWSELGRLADETIQSFLPHNVVYQVRLRHPLYLQFGDVNRNKKKTCLSSCSFFVAPD